MRPAIVSALATLLALSGCGSGEERAAGTNALAGATGNAVETPEAEPAAGGAAACPFRRTREWTGSVEYGRVIVDGYVDVQMAGMRPALTPRTGSAPGTLALELALVPAPGEPIADYARYEVRGAPSYRRGEIWCGGERIASFDMMVIE